MMLPIRISWLRIVTMWNVGQRRALLGDQEQRADRQGDTDDQRRGSRRTHAHPGEGDFNPAHKSESLGLAAPSTRRRVPGSI